MPAQYDLPAAFDTGVEDVDKFNRVPFYLVMNEVKKFSQFDDFTTIWGDINWKPNQGDTMKGVTVQPTPIGNTLFYPNRINTDPKKSVFEALETTETCQLYWHDYQSRKFAFLPSWQDFRDNQLNPFHKDIIRQVGWGNNIFIRTMMWDYSPSIYCAGADLGAELVVGCPTTLGNVDQNAAGSKTSAFIVAAIISKVKATLSFSVIKNLASVAMEDLDIPPFEGMKNSAQPNEAIKGRYILWGGNDAFNQLTDDPDLIARKSLRDDVLFAEFKGPLCNGKIVWKTQYKPIRFNDDGVFINPETIEMPSGKTRPNPTYVAAKYEVAWLLGADAYKTVKVGPPPRNFSGMSKDKFYSMNWNGEIRLTDQFLIQRGTVAGGDITFDTNDDGRFLKFKGTCVHGIMPGERYNSIPVVFLRKRRKGQ